MQLGSIHEQAFKLNKVPKFVPQGDVEEGTAVPHHPWTL